MRKPIMLALLLCSALSGLAMPTAFAQSNSLIAEPAPQIFDPGSGSFSIQNFMEATRSQENRANRRNIGNNIDAEVERFRQFQRMSPDRGSEE